MGCNQSTNSVPTGTDTRNDTVATKDVDSAKDTTAKPDQDPTVALGARIQGRVLDSVGKPVPFATIHMYEDGNDSVSTRRDTANAQGAFEVSVKAGSTKVFIEKDGQLANAVECGKLEPGKVIQLDSLMLGSVLEGSFSLPGLPEGAQISVRVLGSPLDVTVNAQGQVRVKHIQGKESVLIATMVYQNRSVEFRFCVSIRNGKVILTPMEVPIERPESDTSVTERLEIRPQPDQIEMTELLGNTAGNSTWKQKNFGADSIDGLAGAYDGNTVGRLLWHYAFPESLKGRKVKSAQMVFSVLRWGQRPHGGQDLTLEGYRMLRSWKEGQGVGGMLVSEDRDGATAQGPNWNTPWNAPLVGFDGVDAERLPVARATVPYLHTGKFSVDITTAVQGWLEDPSRNYGMIFNSIHTTDRLYLDYPVVGVDDHNSPERRPYFVLELDTEGEDPSLQGVVLQATPEEQDDAILIGSFPGRGTHDGNNQGRRDWEGLGGAWDANTVGRLLYRTALPESLASKTIVSATLSFKVKAYAGRPIQGHDFKVEAYRVLKPWKEGTGDFPGVPNSPNIDGATSLEASWGQPWNRPLVALDGEDAEKNPRARSILRYGDMGWISFDLTETVKDWLARPASNHGLLFRSLEEMHPDYPDYPGFHMSESDQVEYRPRWVIRFR
jgi:hypothetical protein